MSTFDGIIREFPEIRGKTVLLDFFRGLTENPPLACFLSHIHSDHLAGLDTYKGRPVYCSAATRAMLLKLQRRSSRIDFHRGLLEKQEITYKHQKRRLKPLPLETPTEIELEPGRSIRVTLFDANHCPGAVMFLFENNEKAVLYTGDIRSEPWHVNALARSPCLIEYSSGLKRLDSIYLDTSFTEDVVFQTKDQGIRELLEKVAKYPKETNFHFSAWTYGYEGVWIALAKALNTRIHVDDYKLDMYKALQVKIGADQYLHLSPEAPALTGFARGNQFQPGLLTNDDSVRLHSCEKGTRCSTMEKGGIVFISPIVAHLSATSDMAEVGIGGGGGDLEQEDELVLSPEDAQTLVQGVRESKSLPQNIKKSLPNFLLAAASAQHPVTISLPPSDDDEVNSLPDLQRALRVLTEVSERGRGEESAGVLSHKIKFPYSRHSSYRELCHLLQILEPKDVWPCTVDRVRWLKKGITIQGLFGKYCTGDVFQHDEHMVQLEPTPGIEASRQHEYRTSAESEVSEEILASVAQPRAQRKGAPAADDNVNSSQVSTVSLPSVASELSDNSRDHEADGSSRSIMDLTMDRSGSSQEMVIQPRSVSNKRSIGEFLDQGMHVFDANPLGGTISGKHGGGDPMRPFASQEGPASAHALESRRIAFNSVMDASSMCGWPGLLSTTDNHTHLENELGEE